MSYFPGNVLSGRVEKPKASLFDGLEENSTFDKDAMSKPAAKTTASAGETDQV